MKRVMTDWDRFWKNGVVIAWIVSLLSLVISSRINLFIKKSYTFLPVVGMLILGLILIACFKRPRGKEKAENPFVYLLLLAPLVFAWGINPENLGEFAAVRKGLVTGGIELDERAKEELLKRLEEVRAYQHLNLKEILSLEKLAGSEGLKVKTEGLAIEKGDGIKKYYLVRFRITCCAADALPLAVEVQKPENLTVPNNQWVEVWGTIHLRAEGFLLQAEKVFPVPKPQDLYLY